MKNRMNSYEDIRDYLERETGNVVELGLNNQIFVVGKVSYVDNDIVMLENASLSNPARFHTAFPEYIVSLNSITSWGLANQLLSPAPNIGGFRKITPVRGFDSANRDNAKQNNYAWSMAELGEYLYVGTARNIPYSILSNQIFGDIPIPEILIPQNPDFAGEIWRYKKDGSESWQRVYKAPQDPMNIGFRFMVNYNNALYAGALTPLSPNVIILKSTDGLTWNTLPQSVQGFSTRYMVEHNGVLYMGALPLMGVAAAALFSSTDPENNGWTQIDLNGDPDKNPRGNVDVLLSFNGHLYVGTALPTGFELWRTNGATPQKDDWVLVVDKGAGDARNEHPWSLDVFNDYIYIGTAIEVGIRSINPDDPIVPPKGFDVIRVSKDDRWELVIGGKPVVPTQPITGVRGQALSGFPSGFGDITNGYCWQIQAFNGELYLGTWSWNDLIPIYVPYFPALLDELLPQVGSLSPFLDFLSSVFNPGITELLYTLGARRIGCDLWKTRDGVHWVPVSLNGLCNRYNYGIRTLFVSSEGTLYLGTANPFQGCEVWEKRAD
ncbi:MAG: hypothetical protein ACOYD5_01235 [Negativicutes bacterium]